MIEVQNFSKIYKLSKKQMNKEKTKDKTKDKMKIAVDNINFTASRGEIFGLLGPNGAGKTTTLRCISTLLKPTSGTIHVNGYDVVEESTKVRRSIGFLTNELKMEGHFSPAYTMKFFGQLHGMPVKKIEERTEILFEQFGIIPFRDKKIMELSTGMKQKLSIAVSLVHDPEMVIFDEPTSGLDIITARSVVEYLKVLKSEGKLVIISTHIMSVAEKICDRVAIIIDGKKVAENTIEQLVIDNKVNNLEDVFFKLYEANKREVE